MQTPRKADTSDSSQIPETASATATFERLKVGKLDYSLQEVVLRLARCPALRGGLFGVTTPA